MTNEQQRTHQAIDWLIRQQDSAFADWAALTEWLEADAANSAEFARLALVDAEVAESVAATAPARQIDRNEGAHAGAPGWLWENARRRWAVPVGAGLAAACALFLVSEQVTSSRSLYAVVTPPGVRQNVMLSGGTILALNGGTRMMLDHSDARFAQLVDGEASFDVVHDAAQPFRVEVGAAQLVDLGTRFNIRKTADVTELEVAEGAVQYSAKGASVRVDAGQELRATANEVRLAKVDRSAVGAWREGRLVFDSEPLADVADDLSRNTGKRISVDRRIATMPVTAVVQMPRNVDDLPPQLEKLFGIKVRSTTKGWILTPSD